MCKIVRDCDIRKIQVRFLNFSVIFKGGVVGTFGNSISWVSPAELFAISWVVGWWNNFYSWVPPPCPPWLKMELPSIKKNKIIIKKLLWSAKCRITVTSHSPECIWVSSRENLSSGLATRVDWNRPAQPQKLGRGLKFWYRNQRNYII